MRPTTVNVYKFTELSDDAQQRAKDDAASDWGFAWSAECMDSIKALAAHFGGRVKDYSIDWFDNCQSSMSFAMPEMNRGEIRKLLAELGTFNRKTLKGHGDCKLTGYCADENAIDGFRWAFYRDKETDLNALMEAAYDSWIKAACADCANQYSDEQFAENCEANGYEFHEDGSMA